MTEEKAEWHLLRGKEQAGPYPLSKMREAVAQNDLTRTNYVWRHGWPEWRRAGTVPELFPDTATPTDAPPIAPAATDPDIQIETAVADEWATADPFEPEEDAPSGNYLMRHWRGDLPLKWSFWVNGVAVSLVVSLVMLAVSGTGPRTGQMFTIVRTLSVVMLMLAAWQYVGIWRSASEHVERGGERIWAIVAKVMVGIGVIHSLLVIIKLL